MRVLIEGVYQKTKTLLKDKQVGLEALAVKLLEKEILYQSDLEEILGKRPFDNRTTYDEFVNGIEGGLHGESVPVETVVESVIETEEPAKEDSSETK